MKKQRYLSFGYQIQGGKIVVHPAEGKLVPDIFISYLNGNTFRMTEGRILAKAKTVAVVRTAKTGCGRTSAGEAQYSQDKMKNISWQ